GEVVGVEGADEENGGRHGEKKCVPDPICFHPSHCSNSSSDLTIVTRSGVSPRSAAPMSLSSERTSGGISVPYLIVAGSDDSSARRSDSGSAVTATSVSPSARQWRRRAALTS